MIWLVVITMINAAISAAYYLRIIATMFLRSDEAMTTSSVTVVQPDSVHTRRAELAGSLEGVTWPILTAVVLSVIGTLVFGTIPHAADLLGARAQSATAIEGSYPGAPATGATQPTAAAR